MFQGYVGKFLERWEPTLPETNSKRTWQDGIPKGNEKVFQPSIFWGYASFREGTSYEQGYNFTYKGYNPMDKWVGSWVGGLDSWCPLMKGIVT